MESNEDHRARLVIVEHQMEQVSRQVDELSHSINKWMKDQAAAPRPIPFKEIIATALSTLLLFGGVLAFLDSRAATAIEIARLRDGRDTIVQTYRLDQIEKRVNPPIQFVKPVQ